MIEFKRILDRSSVWSSIFHVYSKDMDFVHNVHKCGVSDIRTCVDSSIDNISLKSEFYSVYSDQKLAGMFVINRESSTNVVEGFHVLPEFRSALFFCNYWAMAKELMNNTDTAIGIYDQNKSAIDHLKQNGFCVKGNVEAKGQNHILLVYNF